MTGDPVPAAELTLLRATYRLIGSGLQATLVDAPPVPGRAGDKAWRAGDKAWRCSTCLADFATVRGFDAHVGRHADVCRRQCHLCPLWLVGTAAQLRRHLAIHVAGRQHACRRCGRAFPSSVDLLQHRRRTHARLFRFRCDLCPRSYMQRAHLRFHMLKHAVERTRTCTDCGLIFSNDAALRIHRRLHRKYHRCTWPGCAYLGPSSGVVRAHADNVHRKIRRFRCHHCRKEFYLNCAMQVHMRRMHGERAARWPCTVCDAEFASREHLQAHRRSQHACRWSHECRLCGLAFSSAEARNRHALSHGRVTAARRERPFDCACGRTFRTLLTLRRHRAGRGQGRACRAPSPTGQAQAEPQLQTLSQAQARPQLQLQAPQASHQEQPQSLHQEQPESQPQPKTQSKPRPQPDGELAPLASGAAASPGSPPAVWPSIFCLECHAEFEDGLALQVHYQRHHARDGPYHCPSCGASFSRLRAFAKHRVELHMEYCTGSGTLVSPDDPRVAAAVERAALRADEAGRSADGGDDDAVPSMLCDVDDADLSTSVRDIAGPSMPRVREDAKPGTSGVVGVAGSEQSLVISSVRSVAKNTQGKRKREAPETASKRAQRKTPKTPQSHAKSVTKSATKSASRGRGKPGHDSARAAPAADSGGDSSSDREPTAPAPAPAQPRRQLRSASRPGDTSAADLLRHMLSSSSERAEDTVSEWEPGGSDSDRELHRWLPS